MDKTEVPCQKTPPKSILSLKKMLSLDSTVAEKFDTTKHRSRSADAANIGVKNVRFQEDDMRVKQIYSNHGIRVKMVAHKKSPALHRNPIVNRLLDTMAKKYQDQFGGHNRTMRTLSAHTDLSKAGGKDKYCIELPQLVQWYKTKYRASENQPKRTESATTASAGPYSSELIGSYNGENGRLTDDVQKGSVTDRQADRRKHHSKEREGTLTELRPSSKKNPKQLSIIANGNKSNNLEKEQREKEIGSKDKFKDENSILPPGSLQHKNGVTLTNGFRPMNSRNNFLGGQQITPTLPSQQRSSNTSSSHSRDSDDLIATGTNPLQPQGGGPGGRRQMPGNGAANGGLHSTQSSGALGGMGSTTRKMPTKVLGPSASSRHSRELSDPKYADPLPGAPPTFQQRLSEINSLEQETIRYERTKKFKKKSKSET